MTSATLEDFRGPGATLGAGVSAGFLCGTLIGGLGGRLAMFVLRQTSDPSLRGALTDDGFKIGRVSAETLFLMGVTAGLGILGGIFYLIVRRWIPFRWRIPLMALFFALIGGAGLIGPSEVDFTLLAPLSLAVAFFVLIPAAYGAAMPWMVERLLREGSLLRRGRWTWIIGLAPLVFTNIVGLAILLIAYALWSLGRSAPGLVEAWRSRTATWLGRAAMFALVLTSGISLLHDSIDILD